MATQSEQQLENDLIEQLSGLGYTRVTIKDSNALTANLKTQLEKHNDTSFSDTEFGKILNHLKAGSVLDCASILRDKMHLKRDDGKDSYIEFLNQEHWCQNEYQVTNQVTVEGSYKNRYDVTLLVNGLPLIQIELKRRGLELKEAFNQVNRYHRHSYWAESGLFQYVQVFVISNGVNTKYYANNKRQSFKQTFYWSDVDNNIITQLDKFAALFLEPCHISKMICKYLVITGNALMILRPYQFYAVESIIDRVKHGHSGGYIWHTTGSGKTLTSFKASQILTKLPSVHKLVFVVDRKDLDYQTTKEFNNFKKGCVDGTDNTKKLVEQLSSTLEKDKLIVTTIQKLNTAISKSAYTQKMESLKDEYNSPKN
jgi:type I restriction enzyme, R subunit